MRILILLLCCLIEAAGLAVAGVSENVDFGDDVAVVLQPYIKQGFVLRADSWGGQLAAAETKTIPIQLFKGNEYAFCVGCGQAGVVFSLHAYDADGQLADASFTAKARPTSFGTYGSFAVLRVRASRTATYYLRLEVQKPPSETTDWGLYYAYH